MAFISPLPLTRPVLSTPLHNTHIPPNPRIPPSHRPKHNPPIRMDLPNHGIYSPTTQTSSIRAIIFGATGYIGRNVVFEYIRSGYQVTAFARPRSGVNGKKSQADVRADLSDAHLIFGDVTNPVDIARAFVPLPGQKFTSTIVVSCLASRTGGIADSNKIDYQATLNTLRVGREHDASHFVLLSAVCVQKPELEFQRAKLRFEKELARIAEEDKSFSYCIVRPTAFFKSLAGQVERMKNGAAFVMFGDGDLCKCNALSERDLARFMAICARDVTKRNAILPVGGPGRAVTPKEQAEMVFGLLGREPRYFSLPIGVMDGAVAMLDFLTRGLPFLKDVAEFGRIGRYYAVEDMVAPGFGEDTLEEFFANAIKDGGMKGQDLGDAAIF